MKKYALAIGIWMLIIPLAILNGGFRENVLTNLFDLCMYINEGGGFRDLLKSYDVSTGNLWILVVFTTLVAPVLAGKRRKNV